MYNTSEHVVFAIKQWFILTKAGLCTAAAVKREKPAPPNAAAGKQLGMFLLFLFFL